MKPLEQNQGAEKQGAATAPETLSLEPEIH